MKNTFYFKFNHSFCSSVQIILSVKLVNRTAHTIAEFSIVHFQAGQTFFSFFQKCLLEVRRSWIYFGYFQCFVYRKAFQLCQLTNKHLFHPHNLKQNLKNYISNSFLKKSNSKNSFEKL